MAENKEFTLQDFIGKVNLRRTCQARRSYRTYPR